MGFWARLIYVLSLSYIVSGSLFPATRYKAALRSVATAGASAFFAASQVLHPSLAATIETKTFVNERYHTTLSYPADFEQNSAVLSGDRILDAFIDPSDPDTSVSLVYTPVPADYNRITAFGGKETLQQYLIPRGEGIKTTLLTEKMFGESYMAEYIIDAPEMPVRHVQTVFSLRPQECVVGLTVQTKEESYERFKEKLSVVLPSFHTDLP